MSLYDKVADLPVEIESYELENLEFAYSEEFVRQTTVIRMRGAGEEGAGEDVVYDNLDHIAQQDAGPILDLAGKRSFGELSELLGQTDLFPTAAPSREESRNYRRWAFESAALDLALRQNGKSLGQALEIEPQAVTFVCSTRLTPIGDSGAASPDPVIKRIERYPGLRFKLDPENNWDDELIHRLSVLGVVDILDLKGLYRGTPVDVETDPVLYRECMERFPTAWLEDPDINDETRPVLEHHMERVTWDANLHSVADIEALEVQPHCINSKPSRFGSVQELFAVYEHCEANEIQIYGGGQSELGPGRGHIQYLASLFHPQTPNDVAPSGFNDPKIPHGLPFSPLMPEIRETGFAWD